MYMHEKWKSSAYLGEDGVRLDLARIRGNDHINETNPGAREVVFA